MKVLEGSPEYCQKVQTRYCAVFCVVAVGYHHQGHVLEEILKDFPLYPAYTAERSKHRKSRAVIENWVTASALSLVFLWYVPKNWASLVEMTLGDHPVLPGHNFLPYRHEPPARCTTSFPCQVRRSYAQPYGRLY
jgi:hypothetical protein